MGIEDLKEKVELIKLHCEAGTILEYMNLFDELLEGIDPALTFEEKIEECFSL